MTWSTDGLQFTYTETTESGGTITFTDTYDTAYAAPGSKITGISWSDTSGNSSSITWTTLASDSTETYDADGDKSTAAVSAAGLLKESGTTTWTYVDDDGNTQTSSKTFVHYFDNDTNWTHKGGTETDENNVNTHFGAGFTVAYKTKTISDDIPELDSQDGLAFELHGTANYVAETFKGWNDQDEVETTYYNTAGEVLGTSLQQSHSWTEGSATITVTNVTHQDAAGTWLGNSYSDSKGNEGYFYSETTSSFTAPAHLDLSSYTTLTVEQGKDTWSYTDYATGETVTETREFTHFYDGSSHLGGIEVQNGETIKFGANWEFVGVEKSLSGLDTLDNLTTPDTIANTLYGTAVDGDGNKTGSDVYYDTETWIGWNGNPETEMTFYNASGDKLGHSITMTDTWTMDDQTVTSTHVSYQDNNHNMIGGRWSDSNGNSGSNYESTITSGISEVLTASDGTTTIALDLDSDGETTTNSVANTASTFKFETNSNLAGLETVNISSSTPLIKKQGSDSFSFKMGTETVRESIEYAHFYYDVNGDGFLENSEHIGGYEIRNGETVVYGAGFVQGKKSINLNGDGVYDASTTGLESLVFSGAKYTQKEFTGWNGQPTVEKTFYDTDGVEIGMSFTNTDSWTDAFTGETVTNTHTGYNNADGDWLGSAWSDSKGNEGYFYSETTSSFTAPAHLDLSSYTTLTVEQGKDTWSYTDYATGETVTETREFTHFYDGSSHLGGIEVQNGETIKFGANWEFVGVEKSLSGLDTLDNLTTPDTIANTLYGTAVDGDGNKTGSDVYYDTETWIGWNGNPETEMTFYNASGDKLGHSITMTDTWTMDDQTVTSTHVSYQDNNHNMIGGRWSDSNGNSGSNYESTITSGISEVLTASDGTTTIALDLDSDGETTTNSVANTASTFKFETNSNLAGLETVNISSSTPLIKKQGSDSFSFKMGTETVRESIEYAHFYYDVNGDGFLENSEHIGGYEIRNGETVVYGAGFVQGKKSINLNGDGVYDASTTGLESLVFSGAKYTQKEFTGWNGQPTVEKTFYDTDGVEIGMSFTNTDSWTDAFTDETVTNTHTGYNNADGDWLGSAWSDSKGNEGYFYSETTTSFTAPAHLDLSSYSTLTVEQGKDTWSYTDYATGATVEETREFTHFYNGSSHLGGIEVQDGETIKFGANWAFLGVVKETGSLDTLQQLAADPGTIDPAVVSDAITLYGTAVDGDGNKTGSDVYYDTETWIGWNGNPETEMTFYNASGDKLGHSITMTDTWTMDDQTVTSTHVSYQDNNHNMIGGRWSDSNGNSGSNYESTITSGISEVLTASDGTTTIALDLDSDGETTTNSVANTASTFKFETNSNLAGLETVNISSSTPLIKKQGSDSFSFKMGTETVRESIEYAHFYYDVNGDGFLENSEHIGGYEIRNGETVVYGAGFVQGKKSVDTSGLTPLTDAVDSVAVDAFQADNTTLYPSGVVFSQETRKSWTGFDETETTYYDGQTGEQIGVSYAGNDEFTDHLNQKIFHQYAQYFDSNFEPLARSFVDKNANNDVIRSLTSVEIVQTVTEEPDWLDLDRDGTKGEDTAFSIELLVESGTEVRSFFDGTSEQTETVTFTHYFTNDANREHLGGSEVIDGTTHKIGPNFTQLGTQLSEAAVAGYASLVSEAVNGQAFVFYGAAKFKTETISLTESRTEYYSDAGEILGYSDTFSFEQGYSGTTAIVRTETEYRNGNGRKIGSEWSDTEGNSGQDFTYTTTLQTEPAFLDFDLDGTAGGTLSTGISVRVEEITEDWEGTVSSTTLYFDPSTNGLLGGTSTASGYTSIIGGNGQPTGTIYSPQGAELTIEGVLGMDTWSNATNLSTFEAFGQAMDDTGQASMTPFSIPAIGNNPATSGLEQVGPNFTVQFVGASLDVAGATEGVITGVKVYEGTTIILEGTGLNVPGPLLDAIFSAVGSADAAELEIFFNAVDETIEVNNSSYGEADAIFIGAQIVDAYGNTLEVPAHFTPQVDHVTGQPIPGSFLITKATLVATVEAALAYSSDPNIWNASTSISKVKIYEDLNKSNSLDAADKFVDIDWSVIQGNMAPSVTPVAGADYTLTPWDDVQSVLNSAIDEDGDGDIVVALTGGRYAQDFTISKDIELWGSAKGLAISADGYDADGKVDEVNEVIFDLADRGRGVNETWIDGTVTVASSGVTIDGVRLHTYSGPLKFAGSNVNDFTILNSYVTGFNASDSFRYIDTDGVKSTGWTIDGNLIGGVSGGVGGSLYLTGVEDSIVSDNVFWRPGAAHMYIEDVTNVQFNDNFFLQGLHADGANQDGLYGELRDADNWGYAGFSGNIGYGYGYGYGFGPSGYGPNGYGPDGYGPSGYGPSGYGPNGYGPDGYGPNGYGYQNSSQEYYGRNYVVEVKGVTDSLTFDGNTGKYNSGGIQFWDENDLSNSFTNTTISNNMLSDFFNADPNGLLSQWDSRHKSGITGGVVFSVVDGSASDGLTITGNEFTGSIGEIYNEQDIDALILIQGEVDNVAISSNTLSWTDADSVITNHYGLPSAEVFTQGVYLAGDVANASGQIVLTDNVFYTDTANNYKSSAILVDRRDFTEEGLGQLEADVKIVDTSSSFVDYGFSGYGSDGSEASPIQHVQTLTDVVGSTPLGDILFDPALT